MSGAQLGQAGAVEAPMPDSATSTDSVPTIRLQQVARSYGHGAAQVIALDQIDFTVQKGEFVAEVG